MRTRVLATVGLLLVLVLSACSSGSSGETDPGGSGGPSTGAATSPGTDPSPTQSLPATPSEPPTPEVTPATGAELLVESVDGPVLRVNLPAEADWNVDGAFASVLVAEAGAYDISGGATSTVPGRELGYYADLQADSIGRPAMERLPDRVVTGIEGYVLEGQNASDYYYVFGALYRDFDVTLQFNFPNGRPPAPEWIESVLASAEWL